MLLTKEQILSAPDLATQDVEVPEWGGTVRVRRLPGTDRDAVEKEYAIAQKNGTLVPEMFTARFLARAICDENGKPIFGSEDIRALSAKSSVALRRVFWVAKELNGMGEDELKELEGNSESGQSEDSGSN